MFGCFLRRRSIPQQQDSRWQTAPLRTRAPAGGVPASYPQEKLPILDNPALFEKLDSEGEPFPQARLIARPSGKATSCCRQQQRCRLLTATSLVEVNV